MHKWEDIWEDREKDRTKERRHTDRMTSRGGRGSAFLDTHNKKETLWCCLPWPISSTLGTPVSQ